jgi:hypothetical protein
MNNQISEYTKKYLSKHGQLDAQMVDQPTYRDKLCSWIIKYLSRHIKL